MVLDLLSLSGVINSRNETFEDKRGWKEYNETLVRGGELYLSLGFLDSWDDELAEIFDISYSLQADGRILEETCRFSFPRDEQRITRLYSNVYQK